MQCDNGDAAVVEKACAAEELKFYKAQVDPADRTVLQRTTAEEKETFKPAQDTKMIDFTPGDSSQQFAIGTNLTDKQESALIEFIRENRDVFAWTPSDMPGIPTEFAEHKLHVNPGARPVKQGLRRLNEERRKIVGKETRKNLQ